MGFLRHIRFLTFALLAVLVLQAHYAHAQSFDRTRLTQFDHQFTIGFERNVHTLYTSTAVTMGKKTTQAADRTNRILLRMKLANRFRLETGLSYKAIDRFLYTSGKRQCFNMNNSCKITVPLTIQYQLLSERNRLRPYFGAGMQYYHSGNSTVAGSRTDILPDPILSNRLKYFNLIFTEGLIYDITPDLQITQSIHIVPEQGITPIGINFGIGYRIK